MLGLGLDKRKNLLTLSEEKWQEDGNHAGLSVTFLFML